MNINKSDSKEDKLKEIQPKNYFEAKRKPNSTKVYTNNRRFDSNGDKTTEKSSRLPINNRRTEDYHRFRGSHSSHSNYSHNRDDNHYRRQHYSGHTFYNNSYRTDPSVNRYRRTEPKSDLKSGENQTNCSQQSNSDVTKGCDNLSDNPNPNTSSDKSQPEFRHHSRDWRRTKYETTPEKHEELQRKLDELTALNSIFDKNILTVDESELKGRFLAEPVLNQNQLLITYRIDELNRNNQRFSYRTDRKYPNRDTNNYKSDTKSETQEFCVQHLPPIELYFELSRKYPSKLNPKFLISCKWLTREQMEQICEKLEDLYYESRMEVLFTWFSFLQNDVLCFLGIDNQLDISAILNQKFVRNNWKTGSTFERIDDFQPQIFRGEKRYDSRVAFGVIGAELIHILKSYNEFKRKETFEKSYKFCNICFTSNLGADCSVFPCNHLYCKTCIGNYFITLINEGTVNQIKCPDTECQCKAPSNLVRELVPKELFERYEQLITDAMIGTLSDAYYCPRKLCANLVIADQDSSLAHCTYCGHAFCKHCKATYHGVDPCNMLKDPQKRKEIIEKYQNSNATDRAEMEKKYGKKQLVQALDEAATEKWLEDMSKRCPHCRASIEKSDGCNKMACWRCNTFFCWICLDQLNPTQPYAHFNNPASKCFNQLFLGVRFDAEDLFEDQFD